MMAATLTITWWHLELAQWAVLILFSVANVCSLVLERRNARKLTALVDELGEVLDGLGVAR